MEIEIIIAGSILIALVFLATVDMAFSHLSDLGLRRLASESEEANQTRSTEFLREVLENRPRFRFALSSAIQVLLISFAVLVTLIVRSYDLSSAALLVIALLIALVSTVTFRQVLPRLLVRNETEKKLLDLSVKNVAYFNEEIRKKRTLHLEGKTDIEKKKVLYQLQEYLQLPEVPDHIECFDNSNFQGSYPVSAMVCFRDGVPYKNDYRHFNVKTVEGINDFATMKEVVYRRYKRLLAEDQPLPKLVIIDGGKGQLSAAMESIGKLELNGKITVAGLAKNE